MGAPVRLLFCRRGGVLLGVVVAMLLVGVVGTGVVSTMSGSGMSGVQGNFSTQAYYLAESGYRYVYSVYRADETGENWQAELQDNPAYDVGGGRFTVSALELKDEELSVLVHGDHVDVEPGDAITVTGGDFGDLPAQNGVVTIDGQAYRYRIKNENTNQLEDLKRSDNEEFQVTFNDGAEVDLNRVLSFKTTGIYPFPEGPNTVARTLTYFLPLPEPVTGEGEEGGPGSAGDLALYTSGNLEIGSQNTIDGSVGSDDDVELGNQAKVTGYVIAVDDVELDNQSEVGKWICAGGDVTMGNQTQVGGDIRSQGDVVIGSNNALVMGSVYAVGDVELLNGAEVLGDVHAGGDVTLGSNKSRIHGNVYAGGDVVLNHLAEIGGDVHAAGDVNLPNNGTIEGNVVAGEDVSLGNQSTIEGDVVAGGDIDHGRQTTIAGSETANHSDPQPIPPTAPSACPPICVPEHTEFEAGGTDLSASWNTDITIDPGSYGELNLGGKNKVYLSAGDYYFSEITSGTQPSLYFDLVGGDINIFVEDDVEFGDQLSVYVKDNGGYESIKQGQTLKEHLAPLAAQVYLETLGDFTMSNQNEWLGTIFAKGDIEFSNQNKLLGAYFSSEGEVESANQLEIIHVKANYVRDNLDYQCGVGEGDGGGGSSGPPVPPISY